MIWDWAKGCASTSKEVIPEKKQKVSSEKDSFTCLQCFELHLKGKRDVRFTSLCRTDYSTVERHKKRWHNLPGTKLCMIVPSAAKEVASLKLKYVKQKVPKVTGTEERNMNPASLKTISKDGAQSITATKKKENSELAKTIYEEDPNEVQSATENEESEFKEPLQDIEPLATWDALDYEPQLTTESSKTETMEGTKMFEAKAQSTLLSFEKESNAPKENRTVDMDAIMTAITNLSLKVDDLGAKHRSLQQLVFEDPETGRQGAAMKMAMNISELVETLKLVQWFYDGKSGCVILRCLPCYELYLTAKPTLANLTPLQAQ